MKKVIATQIAGLFATAAFAQTPAAPAGSGKRTTIAISGLNFFYGKTQSLTNVNLNIILNFINPICSIFQVEG